MIEVTDSGAAKSPAPMTPSRFEKRLLRDRRPPAELIAVGAWVLLVLATFVWGEYIIRSGRDMFVAAPPLTGQFAFRIKPWIGLSLIGAGLIVMFGQRVAGSLSWRWLLAASFVAAGAWAVLVAASTGPYQVVAPVLSKFEYLQDVSNVGASPISFLSHFVERIAAYTGHVRSHPPGMVLLLWAMARVGMSGPAWIAALEIAGGAAAVPAVLISVRSVADADTARRTAPFLILAPAVFTIATTADALYMGVGAWGVALLILATARTDRAGDRLALAGGLVFGAGLFLSYGLLPLLLVPLAVAVNRRRFRPLLVAALGVALVAAAFAAAGFWWVDGLLATRLQYLAGASRRRPYAYFLLADLAAFALMVGPAAFAGLSRLRDRRIWLLVGAAIAAIALADLSGMSKAEVERIWLPYVPWVLVAACSLRTRVRGWLTLQVFVTVALQVGVRSLW